MKQIQQVNELHNYIQNVISENRSEEKQKTARVVLKSLNIFIWI